MSIKFPITLEMNYKGAFPVVVTESDFTDGFNNRAFDFGVCTNARKTGSVISAVRANGKSFRLHNSRRVYKGIELRFPPGALSL